MLNVAVRKETKNKWERRTPLNPASTRSLIAQGVPLQVEKSALRIFANEEYQNAGARLVANTDEAQVVVGIKEPPLETIRPGQIHLAFAHVIKGQPYNMPLLQKFLDQKATLIDYEPMVDDDGNRIASVFSRYAGMSGTIESLRVVGQKLAARNRPSRLGDLKQPWEYGRLAVATEALRALAPLKEPLRILIVGAGNVGHGCIRMCTELGLPQITPEALEGTPPEGPWFAVVDAAEIVRARDGRPFDFSTYIELGSELFESTFARLLGKFDVLLQGAYWDERYPRQLPRTLIKERAEDLPFVIGDISCDLDGTLECTTQATSIDEPAFTFNTATMTPQPGVSWDGPTIMSIDNLPCELAADASDEFSALMERSILSVAQADTTQPLEASGLSSELQRGVIVYKGELTPKFRHLSRYL